MSVIDTTDRERVVSVAEDGTPVTGAMVDEWERAYAAGALPDGYAPDGAARAGRPTRAASRRAPTCARS